MEIRMGPAFGRTVVAATGIVVSFTGCSGGSPMAEPSDLVVAIEESWRRSDSLSPDDMFSPTERACIDDLPGADDIDPIDFGGYRTYADQSDEIQLFVADYFDQCLSDDHMRRWFYTDMTGRDDLRFTAKQADCLATKLVVLVHAEGFADVFRDRSERIDDEIERLRGSCGIS